MSRRYRHVKSKVRDDIYGTKPKPKAKGDTKSATTRKQPTRQTGKAAKSRGRGHSASQGGTSKKAGRTTRARSQARPNTAARKAAAKAARRVRAKSQMRRRKSPSGRAQAAKRTPKGKTDAAPPPSNKAGAAANSHTEQQQQPVFSASKDTKPAVTSSIPASSSASSMADAASRYAAATARSSTMPMGFHASKPTGNKKKKLFRFLLRSDSAEALADTLKLRNLRSMLANAEDLTARERIIAQRKIRLMEVEKAYLDRLKAHMATTLPELKTKAKDYKMRQEQASRQMLLRMNQLKGSSLSLFSSPMSPEEKTADDTPPLKSSMSADTLPRPTSPTDTEVADLASSTSVVDEAALKQRMDKLTTKVLEVESVLRAPLESEADLTAAAQQLQQVEAFWTDLQAVAAAQDTLMGTIFQALLARNGGADASKFNMAYNRDRSAKAQVDLLSMYDNDEKRLEAAVKGASLLCSLIRVKVEDDNDLMLALGVVKECVEFFSELEACASLHTTSGDVNANAKPMAPFELFQEIRMF